MAAFLAAACSLLRPCCGPWRRVVSACLSAARMRMPSVRPETNTKVGGSLGLFGGSLVVFVSALLHRRSSQQVAPSPRLGTTVVKSKSPKRKDNIAARSLAALSSFPLFWEATIKCSLVNYCLGLIVLLVVPPFSPYCVL